MLVNYLVKKFIRPILDLRSSAFADTIYSTPVSKQVEGVPTLRRTAEKHVDM
jgi:hypothetical protein